MRNLLLDIVLRHPIVVVWAAIALAIAADVLVLAVLVLAWRLFNA